MSFLPSDDLDSQDGAALVITLILLALVSLSITYFTKRAIHKHQLSSQRVDQQWLQRAARGTLDWWMAELRADALSYGRGVVISEVMNHWPDQRGRGLLITGIEQTSSGALVEIFNPTPRTLRLLQFNHARARGPRAKTYHRAVGPGESIVICDYRLCRSKQHSRPLTIERPHFQLSPNDGLLIVSYGDHLKTPVIDAVGWRKAERFLPDDSYREGSALVVEENIRWRRRSNENDIPIDTSDNRSDFTAAQSLSDDRYASKETTRSFVDANEYVEIYNTAQSEIDPVREGFRLRINGDKTVGVDALNGNRDQTRLPPGGVGLIVHPAVDTRGLGIKPSKMDRVRLYSFGANGRQKNLLADDQLNSIELVKPNPNYRNHQVYSRVVSDTEYALKAQYGREKREFTDGGGGQSWHVTPGGGSPGRVPISSPTEDRVDSYHDVWARGLQEGEGPGTEQVFSFPSMERGRKEGRRATVQLLSIEDETGKLPLNSSLSRYLTKDNPLVQQGVIQETRIDTVINKASTISGPGGIQLLAPYIEMDTNALASLFSPYRHDELGEININTARYGVLRSIPVEKTRGRTYYLTDELARHIMKRRPPLSNHFDERSRLTRLTVGGDDEEGAWLSVSNICDEPIFESAAHFDCGVFRRHATVKNEGVFRAMIRIGGLPDQDLEDVLLEGYVDRRPVIQGNGPMDLLWMRQQHSSAGPNDK